MNPLLENFMSLINGGTEETGDEYDERYDHYLNDLHDKFAMAALTGYLSAPGPVGDEARGNPLTAVKWAYLVADESMEQRVKEPKDGGPQFNVENYP